jgi:hypothetical protein
MSYVIGVVCEGPTDYEVIKRVVDGITQVRNEYLRLHPEELPIGPFGNGWKGVWKWCETYEPILDKYLRGATPRIDCLIVHMDGDVSRKEKEVHCGCASLICELSGSLHPLECRVCKDGGCPVVLPCVTHDDYAAHLNGLIVSWLRPSSTSLPIIVTIPCDSIDTWVAVAYSDLIVHCENHVEPWNTIIAHGAFYHGIRIHGKKKHVSVYRELAVSVCANWGTVKSLCPQAQALEDAVLDMVNRGQEQCPAGS